jgi:hypothetical protein
MKMDLGASGSAAALDSSAAATALQTPETSTPSVAQRVTSRFRRKHFIFMFV